MPEPATLFRLKTALDHLPAAKQRQLQDIVELLRQSKLRVYYLILFGSYARGDWVEDAENRYFSDYDLLAVTTAKELKKVKRWAVWEKQAQTVAGNVPITLLIHALGDVNEELRLGNYFFGDIVKEGIVLFESGKRHLVAPQELNPAERLAVANRNLHRWFNSASGFWRGCGYFMVRHEWAHAAFLLHQAVERYYHTVTLVESGYKHKNHDIAWLADLGATLHPALMDAMPRIGAEDQQRFELLRRAYIDARYSDDYRITEAELTALREHVRDLAIRVRQAGGELLGRFCGPDAVVSLGELPKPPDYSEESELPPLPELSDPEVVKWWGRMVRSEGKEEGLVEGEVRGREAGLIEGEVRGEERRATRIALSLLAEGMSEDQVARLTGLTQAEVVTLGQDR